MLFFLLMNKSIFSIQQISLKYKPEERFEPIGYSIFLPDSRIIFISRFVLSQCCHKIMVIDPKSPNNNFSFDYCNSKVFTLELLDNGHIITSPNVSMFDISNPSNIKEYNVTNEYNSSYGYALLPNNEIAIFYLDAKINIHHRDCPYQYKYTLQNFIFNHYIPFGKYIHSVKKLLIFLYNLSKKCYSIHFYDMTTKEIVTSIKWNPTRSLCPNIIELKECRLLLEDNEAFYVLNLKTFCIEKSFEYQLDEYETTHFMIVSFLINANDEQLKTLPLFNGLYNKIESYNTFTFGNDKLLVLRMKRGYICTYQIDDYVLFYFEPNGALYKLTNNFNYSNYE